tara:strand:+ start:58782 stop:58982 length:201 start_codon:yes stop_codon:yes gene_type:complete
MGTCCVLIAVSMLAAIEFNEQHGLPTGKVGDIGSDRMLTHEFVVVDLPIAQHLPEAMLGFSLVSAQ